MTPLPMSKKYLQHPVYWLLSAAAALIVLFTVLSSTTPVRAEAPASHPEQKTEEYCLSCHNNPDLKLTFPNGEELSLFVSPQVLAQSVHSPAGIECEACHTTITTYPHPKQTFTDSRSLSLSYYQACQKCHSANYIETLDSMHFEIAEKGNLDSPICTDCHGSHDVRDPNQPRSLVSSTCGECHSGIYSAYAQSIHGKALIEEDNLDVPVCTDCHGVHNVQDPRTDDFRVQTPEMCAHCHADSKLMDKYNLPSNVYSLYELSWHGVEVSVYKARWPTIWHDTAVCTDCHGIHEILAATNPASSVHPDNLLTTCQKCHPGAGPNWTGAWTGHEEISLEKTPFLFYTHEFYSSFTPFILWLSIIYVILQILRSTVDRVKRSLR